jgi:hypothetical protein
MANPNDIAAVRPNLNVIAQWCPESRRWPVFIGICVVALGIAWTSSGMWEVVLGLSPIVALIGAMAAFNRTEIQVDDKRVTWKIRPFPLQRERSVKLEEIKSWVHGEAPVSTKDRYRKTRLITYAGGIERKNGKVMVIRTGFTERKDAENFVKQFADYTSIRMHSMVELRGAGRGRKHGWPTWIAAGLFAALLIWVVAFQD